MNYNNIYQGDCYQLIKQLPDKSVDLIITDPPYEIVGGGGGGCFGDKKRNYHKEYQKLSTNTTEDKKHYECAGFNYEILQELDRVMKHIYIYIFCNKNQVSSLMKHYEDKGCNVDLLVWCKTNPTPTCNNKYLSDVEYCVFARDKGCKLYGSYKTKSKFYVSPVNVKDKKLYKHPTIKPMELVKRFISNSTIEGDVVLDPFLGSGTTAKACQELNRKYIGFEINEEYYNIALARLNEKKDIASITNEIDDLLENL